MNVFIFLPYYVRWHYSRAISDMLNLWKNLFVFVYNFFSIHTLFLNFFAPLQRMGESYTSRFDIGEFFNTLVVNTIMRVVGAIARSIVIGIGLVVLVFSLALFCALFVVWLFAPLFLFSLGISGLMQLIL